MLTPQEQALIAELRANARPTGEDDARRKSDLRRGQRRLLAIIDRLTDDEPQQTATTARKAIEVCRLVSKWSERVFCSGFGLMLKNGCPVDHTELNEAWRLSKEVLEPTRGPRHPMPYALDEAQYITPEMLAAAPTADDIARALLCDDCPPDGYPTDKTRCRECPRRRKEPGHAQTDSVDL